MVKGNYSAIVFDLGNVLLDIDNDIIIDNLEEIEKGLGTNFYELYQKNYDLHIKLEKGEISDEDFTKVMLNWLDHKISAEEFSHIFSNFFKVNDDVTSLLPILKDNYTLVALSNTNHIHQKYGWGNLEFLRFFDKLILSHETGARKPEEKIYKAVEEFTKKPPHEHYFIDDLPDFTEGARKVGWDAIHFNGYENLVKELKEKGII